MATSKVSVDHQLVPTYYKSKNILPDDVRKCGRSPALPYSEFPAPRPPAPGCFALLFKWVPSLSAIPACIKEAIDVLKFILKCINNGGIDLKLLAKGY
jgi:hypothetical protein